MSRGLTILGVTGSVGRSTLDVLAAHPGAFRVEAVAAGSRAAELAAVVREHRPAAAALARAEAVTDELVRACRESGTDLVTGPDAARQVAAHPGGEIVLAAIVGAAGLPATAAAVERGATVALANKESLVVAGGPITAMARRSGAQLLPVDSEHAAVHQALRSGTREEVRRIILTASGGPFRTRAASTFASITIEEALAHPTWRMGGKITIDSATLMNKGLEVIEAHWLFDLRPDQIDVVVHPQSIIHSLVEFRDGQVLAQLSRPDMKDPIRYCLFWPQRPEAPVASLDLAATATLTFEAADVVKSPCLALARQALVAGGAATAVLNAANEIAVEEFLAGRISFVAIARVVEDALSAHAGLSASTVEESLAVDALVRAGCRERASVRSA